MSNGVEEEREQIDEEFARRRQGEEGAVAENGPEHLDVRRMKRYAQTDLQRVQSAPEKELVADWHTENIRIGALMATEHAFRDALAPREVQDRWSILQTYQFAGNKARGLRLGIRGLTPLREALEIPDEIYTLVPILDLRERTVPEEAKPYVIERIEEENKLIREARLDNEAEIAEAEARRTEVIAELEETQRYLGSVARFTREIAFWRAAGGDLGNYAKKFENEAEGDYPLPSDFKRVFSRGPAINIGDPGLVEEVRKVNPELLTDFNRAIDRVFWAYYVIGKSEKPEELLDLMQRPGWSLRWTDKEVEEWFGRIREWRRPKIGSDGKVAEDASRRREDDFRKTEAGKRGRLTEFGNIFSSGETEAELNEIRKRMRDFCGSDLAEEIAYWTFKFWSVDAECGADVFWDEKTRKVKIRIEGHPSSSDFVKLRWMRLKRVKEMLAGSNCGPEQTIDNYGDGLIVDFTRFATTGEESDKRSIFEMCWGYNQDGSLPSEPAQRLGELDWESIARNVHAQWWLRNWFAGRPDGVFDRLMATQHDPSKVITTNNWKAFNKERLIVQGEPLVTRGEYRRWKGRGVDKEVAALQDGTLVAYTTALMSLPDNLPWLNARGRFSTNPNEEASTTLTNRMRSSLEAKKKNVKV